MSAKSPKVAEPESTVDEFDNAGAAGPESTVDEFDNGADVVESDDGVAAEPESGGHEPAPGEAPLDLAAVVAERDGYLEDLQRVTAEFTNFRRQTLKRNTELVAQAAAGLARALLPVLDACEAAVSQGVEGIEAVQSQLLGVLSAEGLTVLGSIDEPFDPGFHEAVMSEESSGDGEDAPVVAEVLRTGYAWHGRVLRPAMVKVRG